MSAPEANTVESLSSHLVQRIKQGYYAPGQRLIEAELMETYGVGRSRIRETLRTLAGEGYLSIEKNRGVCVRRFTRQEAMERGRAREVLEGLAARQLTEKGLSAEQKRELEELQAALDEAARQLDIEGYARLNVSFHHFITTHAGNNTVADLLQRLNVPLFRVQFRALFTVSGMFKRNEDHQKITRAILAGDPDAAEAAMREHVRHGVADMERQTDDTYA